MTASAAVRAPTALLCALVSAGAWFATACGAPDEARTPGAGGSGGSAASVGSGGSGVKDAGGFTGSGGAIGASGTDGSTECNSLELVGPVVVGDYVQGEVPAGIGGSIVDGTYDAREYQAFVASAPQPGAPPARLFRHAIRLLEGATRFESADARPVDGGEIVSRTSGELMVFDGNLTLSYTCPQALVNERATLQFSVLGDDLVLITDDSVATYRRR